MQCKDRFLMKYSIRLNGEKAKLFKSYAKLHGCSLSKALKRTLFKKNEDEYDIVLVELEHIKYLKDSETNSHEELMKELNLQRSLL